MSESTLTTEPRLPATVSSASTRSTSGFAKHALLFTGANLLSLGLNGALAFLIPKLLSINDYGYYRLFVLYGSFAGLLHLGFIDGLIVRWAAQPKRRIKSELDAALRFLLFEHVLLLGVLLVFTLFYRGRQWLWLVLATAGYVIFWNWASLGQSALQALKRFEPISLLVISGPGLFLVSTIGLHAAKMLDLNSLLFACVLSNLFAAAVQWFYVKRIALSGPQVAVGAWKVGAGNLRLGWSILGANILATVALALDRLAVSAKFTILDFAIYSFACNALSLTYSMVVAVSMVAFPYLSEGISEESRCRVYGIAEDSLLLLWAVGLATFFPIAWIIVHWLPSYVSSLPLLRILMLPIGLTAGIYVLHSPYFRVTLKQNRFLAAASIGAASAGIFIWWGVRIRSLEWIAAAMVSSALAWWLADEFLLRESVRRNLPDIFWSLGRVVVCGCVFWLCAARPDSPLYFLIYLGWTALLFATAGRRVFGVARPHLSQVLSRVQFGNGFFN